MVAWPAYASVCAPVPTQDFLVVDRANLESTRLYAAGMRTVGAAEHAYIARLWQRRSDDDARAVRLAHDYRAYQIATSPGRALQTNGHLHRLSGIWQLAGPRWEISFSPGIATSSNALRHPDAIDAESVFWRGFLRRRHAWTAAVDVFWGICRDDRFGASRLTPVLGIDWRVNDDAELTLGYPHARLRWRLHPRLRLHADIHPAGGRWRVYDDALARRSMFALESWRLSLGLSLQVTPAHALIIGGGREVRRQFAFRLDDGTEIQTRAGDAAFAGIRWRWRR